MSKINKHKSLINITNKKTTINDIINIQKIVNQGGLHTLTDIQYNQLMDNIGIELPQSTKLDKK